MIALNLQSFLDRLIKDHYQMQINKSIKMQITNSFCCWWRTVYNLMQTYQPYSYKVFSSVFVCNIDTKWCIDSIPTNANNGIHTQFTKNHLIGLSWICFNNFCMAFTLVLKLNARRLIRPLPHKLWNESCCSIWTFG